MGVKLLYVFLGKLLLFGGDMVVKVGPVLSILFGILILVFPRALNYLVAIYLILAGLVALGVVAFA